MELRRRALSVIGALHCLRVREISHTPLRATFRSFRSLSLACYTVPEGVTLRATGGEISKHSEHDMRPKGRPRVFESSRPIVQMPQVWSFWHSKGSSTESCCGVLNTKT